MFIRFDKRFFASEKGEGAEATETEEVTEAEGAEATETEEVTEAEGAEATETEEATEAEGADPAASQVRRETRIAKLARQRDEEREARIRAETRLEEASRARTEPAQSRDPEEARRIREEKLSLMSPEEKRAFLQDEEIGRLRQGQMRTEVLIKDTADKAAYQAEKTSDPLVGKYEKEVEEAYQTSIRNGLFVPRLALLDYIVGKKMREQARKPASKATVKAKQDASVRVASATAKPASARADGNAGGKGEETLEQMRTRLLAREAAGNT